MDIQIKQKRLEKEKKIIGTYVDIDTYNKLQEEADKNFTSLSSLVRKIIYFYINADKKDEE